VLIALNFANSLVEPIRRLMGAADLVSTGNLNVQVPVLRSEGDLAQLGKTFNKMTDELRTQRDDLVRASEVIDSRRRFTEAVLSSASAGIIGVDGDGKIGILNRSSEKLIGHPEAEALGHPLAEIVPELDEIMASAREGVQRLVQGQITVSRGGRDRILSVRVSAELSGQFEHFAVIAHFNQYKRRGIAVNLDGFDRAKVGAHSSNNLDQFPVGFFQVNEQHNQSRISVEYRFEHGFHYSSAINGMQ